MIFRGEGTRRGAMKAEAGDGECASESDHDLRPLSKWKEKHSVLRQSRNKTEKSGPQQRESTGDHGHERAS